MSKTYSKRFWITFWSISVLFLVGWFFFWQIKNKNVMMLDNAVNYLPISEEKKDRLKTVTYFTDYLLKNDNQEKTFLILFQNNMELRPGGGYIGTFGILKTKNGQITKLETNNLSVFDVRIPSTVPPPYPMRETLGIDSLKLRDSNYSPDFEENAKRAEDFYHMGQGQENFDGIVAVNSNVLTSFLKVTGPVEIPGYPGTYDSENAILTLEYQVEKGYVDQGINRAERKSVMNDLGDAIIKKVFTLNDMDKLRLGEIIMEDLNNKDIQLNFKNEELQKKAEEAKWAGLVNQDWKQDYLMIVDSNLGAFKSDYYMKRSFEYTVDLSKDVPEANLKITYTHTGKVKDWMTKDYLTYLRTYVPSGSWLIDSKNFPNAKFGDELGKKYFGSLIGVPLDQTRTVELTYSLPGDFKNHPYNLLIQKQSGVENIPGHITIIEKDGSRKTQDIELKGDWTLN